MPLTPELARVADRLRGVPRHPAQVGGFAECDCEVVDGIAVTVDAIDEEIARGLYRDPFTAGWVAAVASLSDLAAARAEPLGLLLSAHWAREWEEERRQQAVAGFAAACAAAGVFLLGGDTGEAPHTILTSVGLGRCAQPRLRTGLMPGDTLCLLGEHGNGAILALSVLLGLPGTDVIEGAYRPRPPVANSLRLDAVAGMDTSDGLVATLLTLGSLNGVGFDLTMAGSVHPDAVRWCEGRGIPPLALWISDHGDYQLVLGFRGEVPQCEGLRVLGKVTASECRIDGKSVDLAGLTSIASIARNDAGLAFATLAALL